MSRFHTLNVKDVRRETPEAVSILFDIPKALKDEYTFKPGQYLTLRTVVDGEDTRRSYSICSGLDDDEIRVAVKKVEGGTFSTFANDQLKAGMSLEVMAPEGRFTAEVDGAEGRNYVAFAAGSGITPILSIIKTSLQREPESSFTLFYGNKESASVLFREELEDLKDRYLGRFTLTHVLSREGQDIDLLHGRLDGERIRQFIERNLVDLENTDAFYLCGPGDMIETGRKLLEGHGVSPDKIRFELFTPADGSTTAKSPSAKANSVAEGGVEIAVILDGAQRSFTMNETDLSVIDAAHRQGLELPFSCKGGMCCTCRAKVVKGEVEMANNYSLEPWEVEAGFVLTCQARPLTKDVLIDFDEM
ncbi:1,2-phenylacetyl-CoA epoxidase subunit PaaE [Pseudovibrio sp. SPO723]|uniref:1,2-phenylacetyl-CoA epoxidase subunit PaaE n=1 Tax=Nesiotobacter zosterae TaxID=392721 RepID=UPI0029C4BB6F|nr:1,2-phenylacetyl-CoA epoxidase subunit PaaE [Pseudovibrio sp. SPO723]MDX5593537.1 1,2-phenylacetyl-CoA epoxidase subunit PaaE [Pseudovibrio sp. SPO723]